MSKLEELVQQLCPDGVEYKELGAVATISRGGNFQKKDYVKNGFPCIHYGQIYTKYNLFVNDVVSYINPQTAEKQKKAVHGDIIMAVTSENIEDVCKCVAWLGSGGIAVSGHTAIIHHILDPKYLVYYLNSSLFYQQKLKLVQGTKVMEVSPDKLKKVTIPVPPMEVQREIVRILDQFTELTAELTARKKQHEHYRDELFRTAKDAEIYYLNEISENCDNQRKPVTSGNRIVGEYPYYGASGIVDYVDNYIFDGDYLLISEDGANLLARNTPIAFSISGKNWVNNHAHVLRFDTYETRRYVEIYLNSIDLSLYITGGAQPKLNQKNLNKIPIPLPSPDEQRRIVSILDRFDALCNDLTSGLPAEIKARRKQYEYYRDKLLTFQEAKV